MKTYEQMIQDILNNSEMDPEDKAFAIQQIRDLQKMEENNKNMSKKERDDFEDSCNDFVM